MITKTVASQQTALRGSLPTDNADETYGIYGVRMAPQGEATLPATRRTRKSIGGGPSTKKADKENATVDVGSAMGRKKSRSKSMGPGGLDPLKMGNGNRRAVRYLTWRGVLEMWLLMVSSPLPSRRHDPF
jgi:hypothetical protein